MMINEELLSILACPKCKGPLAYIRRPQTAGVSDKNQAGEHLDCSKCRLRYRIEKNIPVMLAEEAQSY